VKDSSNSTRLEVEESNEAPSAQHDSKWHQFNEYIEIDGPIESMKVSEQLAQSSHEQVESDDEEIVEIPTDAEASGDAEEVSSPAPITEESSGHSEDPLEFVHTPEDSVTSPELFREDEEWEQAVESLQGSTTAESESDATSTLDPLELLGSLDELDELLDSRKPRKLKILN